MLLELFLDRTRHTETAHRLQPLTQAPARGDPGGVCSGQMLAFEVAGPRHGLSACIPDVHEDDRRTVTRLLLRALSLYSLHGVMAGTRGEAGR